jgi:23S rRNA (cytidine1920-2'-O)/16S rRNA (cytidine1409-2'-O)-methyltransferase
LDVQLVARGLVPSRERARALILAGKVRVGERLATKAGEYIAAADMLSLVEPDHPYVSRGGLKLAHALDQFAQARGAGGRGPLGGLLRGAVALDVGASTGGFTDVLLRWGAARVYAVDVGYGQLAWSLRQDPRVVAIERQNVRHLTSAQLGDGAGRIDLATVDVSFISLTLVLPMLRELVRPDSPVVALIKPQFEVGKGAVGKGGVVRDPRLREGAIATVLTEAQGLGFSVHDTVESPIVGPAGNVEFLVLLWTPGTPATPPNG